METRLGEDLLAYQLRLTNRSLISLILPGSCNRDALQPGAQGQGGGVGVALGWACRMPLCWPGKKPFTAVARVVAACRGAYLISLWFWQYCSYIL